MESELKYAAISDNSDVIKLLELIRSIALNYESKRYTHLLIFNAMKSYYIHYQKNLVTCNNYLEAHQNLREVVEHCGGNPNVHELLVDYSLKEKGITTPNDTEQ